MFVIKTNYPAHTHTHMKFKRIIRDEHEEKDD